MILDACSDPSAWSPAGVRALLQVIVDNYAGRAEVIAPMVIRAIASLDVVDRAEPTLQIVAARTANDHWSSATRRRLQAFVSATAEDHWSSETRRLLGPFATALQDIDIPLPYYFAGSSSFGRLVRFGDHGVDIEPSLAASLARLAGEAAARPKRRRWEAEFDSMVDLAGVRELLALVVESAMAATTASYEEDIVLGAATLLGAHARCSSDSSSLPATVDLLERLAFWGAKWDDIRPTSAPIARGAVAGLRETGSELAIVALHRLQERYRDRKGLARPVEEALEALLAGTSNSLASVLASTGPTFGLGADAERRWETPDGTVVLRMNNGTAVVEPPTPCTDAPGYAAVREEALQLAIGANRELGVLRRRLDGSIRDATRLSPEDFEALAHRNPLSAALARTLFWRFGDGDRWTTGRPAEGGGIELADGSVVESAWTEATLWHPLFADAAEASALRDVVLRDRIDQAARQVFRETCDEAGAAIIDTPLRASKTEALLRSRGWKVSSLGGWDGGDVGTARLAKPQIGCSVEIGIEIPPLDSAGPRGAGSWCLVTEITFDTGARLVDDPVRRIFVSEALRDLELAIVAASPTAQDAEDPASPFHAVTLAACAEPLRGTGRMRRLVLELLLAGEMQSDRLSLTENELLVECGSGTYRVHLNAGLVRDPAGRLTAKRGSTGIVLPWLPMEATGTLARIVRVALGLR